MTEIIAASTIKGKAATSSDHLATLAQVDAKVTQTITNGVTATAPSEDAVFDALALKAPLASPALTGSPTAPTQSAADNSTKIATTAYADSAASTAAGASVVDSIADSDTTHAPSRNAVFDALALKAPLASPALTGTPTAPTASANTNTTQVATTAYADAKVADAINDGTTTVAPSQNVVFDQLALKAPLASPTLTGTPAAPTAAGGTNTTQIATTAFVTTAANAKVTQTITNGTTTTAPSEDAVFDALALKAPIASPTFTGTATTPALKVTGGTPESGRILIGDADGDLTWARGPLSGLMGGVDAYAYGNSWTLYATYGIPWPDRIAAKLGLDTLANRGTGGYRMQDTAIDALSPGTNVWTSGSGGLVVVGDLLNNLIETDDTANRGAALESARALCAILSSASRTEISTGTFSTAGLAWNQQNVTASIASGGSYAWTTTEGSYVDVTVPAGTSYLVMFGGDGTTFVGGSVTATQGSLSFTKDLNEKAKITPWRGSQGVAPVVMRMTGLAAGTLRVTCSKAGRGGTVYCFVDAVLPQMTAPPTIAFIKPTETRDANHYPKATFLAYLRTIPDLLAAEFPNVVVVDPDAGWDPVGFLAPDELHPNEAGAEHIANHIAAAVGIKAPLATKEPVGAMRGSHMATGGWVCGGSFQAATLMTANLMAGQVLRAARTCVIDQLGVTVTVVGSAGSVIRLGVYAITYGADGVPVATLLVDAGTVVGTSVTTQTIALANPLLVTAGTLLWIVASGQGAPTTQPTVNAGINHNSGFVAASAATATAGTFSYFVASVTGAFASSPTVSVTSGSVPRIAAHIYQ